jgi:diguanylate cyclase (GGDEF)-like protein
MRIEASFLRSRVARRIFLLFVLSAVVPISLLLGLSLREMNRDLIQRVHRELHQAAKAYAMSVYERLLLADEELALLSGSTNETKVAEWLSSTPSPRYASLMMGSRDGQRQLYGPHPAALNLLPGQWARLARDEPLLAFIFSSRSQPEVMVVHPEGSGRGRDAYMAAVLRPEYLWGSRESLPYLTGFCIYNQGGALLHCTDPAYERLMVGDAQQRQDSGLLTDAFPLFLGGRFAAREWRVVALRPRPELQSSLQSMNRIFIGVALLSVLLVALLSVVQIRRTLVPLESLIGGTRRLARRDFSPLPIPPRRDEFTELTRGFNAMAEEIQTQFQVLDAQGRIDRMILSELNLERILETVLQGLREVAPADTLCVAALDRNLRDKAHLHCLRGKGLTVERIASGSEALAFIGNADSGLRVHRATYGGQALLPDWPDEPHVFYLPVYWKNELVAILGLGFATGERITEDRLGHVREIAGRIGVALSALAREEELYRQAHYDSLTGLPNRLMFLDWLDRETRSAIRQDETLALLFIDLDRFKIVNDSRGHSAGDLLLKEVAYRLQKVVRGDSLIARLGGDEFTVALPRLDQKIHAGIVAGHIREELAKPFTIHGHEYHVGASIGIAFCPQDSSTSETLIRNADTAMYQAKEHGRGQYMYFEEDMNEDVLARLQLDNELRGALDRDEFVVYWQPQRHMQGSTLAGAEALVRWQHPQRGVVAPGAFIGYAEQSGLVEAISTRVIEKTCEQLRDWMDRGIAPPLVAVNISARELKQAGLVDRITALVGRYGVPFERVELEITESSFIHDLQSVSQKLKDLQRLGFKIAIDDFGTGYSSLSYLSRLSADVLKIDRSFVMHVAHQASYRSICRAIILMGHALDMTVVAEGVETEEEQAILRDEGCDVLQGYLYSKPLSSTQFEEFQQLQQAPGQRTAAGGI